MAQFIKMIDGGHIPLDLWAKFKTATFFPKEDFLLFEEAKEFAKKLKLKNRKKWNKYSKSGKKPNNIPSNPNTIYKDKGWISWGDFLGTGNMYKKDFLSFEEAKIFAIKLKLKNRKGWYEYCKSRNKPNNIPVNPSIVYKDKGWINWGDFLGTGYVHKKDFLSFKEARKFAKKLKLKGQKEWQKYCKSSNKPNNIPFNPDRIYKEWIDWYDWLGKKRKIA